MKLACRQSLLNVIYNAFHARTVRFVLTGPDIQRTAAQHVVRPSLWRFGATKSGT
jgi:hypothetical protein